MTPHPHAHAHAHALKYFTYAYARTHWDPTLPPLRLHPCGSINRVSDWSDGPTADGDDSGFRHDAPRRSACLAEP